MQSASPPNCPSDAPTLERPNVPTWVPRRRPGPPSKISKLRPELLSLVNELLDQGKSYEAVIEELARHGVKLNYDNVSKWYNGPYQDYVAAKSFRDDLHTLRDDILTHTEEPADVRLQESFVQLGLTYLLRSFRDNHFREDPRHSIRLYNSLARLSHQALTLRKYADEKELAPTL
jgi:hypothetical protein